MGPCMCGATDCPSCGPAQGYTLVRRYDPRTRLFWWEQTDAYDDFDDFDEPEPEENRDQT